MRNVLDTILQSANKIFWTRFAEKSYLFEHRPGGGYEGFECGYGGLSSYFLSFIDNLVYNYFMIGFFGAFSWFTNGVEWNMIM